MCTKTSIDSATLVPDRSLSSFDAHILERGGALNFRVQRVFVLGRGISLSHSIQFLRVSDSIIFFRGASFVYDHISRLANKNTSIKVHPQNASLRPRLAFRSEFL